MQSRNKILIVDDNPVNVEVLEEILTEFDLRSVESGEAALNIFNKFRPDLVLLDIMMPGIDGYETCRRLRRGEKNKQTKVILVSAKPSISDRLKGFDAGADDYITKPFDSNELLAKVKVYVKLKYIEDREALNDELLRLLCLRTNNPLLSILDPLNTAIYGDLPLKEENQYIERAYESVVSLQKLFQKVFTLNQLKLNEFSFNFERYDLCNLVRDATHSLESIASSHNVVISEVFAESAFAEIDRRQIAFVISSLLENAIRYSKPQQKVTVIVAPETNYHTVTVIDRGKGIETDSLASIFDEFTYVDVQSHTKWHGLSLALSQQIVAAHNGKLDFSSCPNEGTTVKLRIPV